MQRLLLLPALVLAAALAIVSNAASQPVDAADAPAADLSASVLMYCRPDNTVSLLLRWTTSRAGPQWVDLSPADDSFAPGTFIGNGPLSAGQDTLLWDGLQPATWYFLRVNTLTPFGWFTGDTRAYYTLDDCSSAEAQLSLPPPPGCLDVLSTPFPAACLWTSKPDGAAYGLGERVLYCYAVSQAMSVRIVATKPDGSQFDVFNGFDPGTGACIGPYQAALPHGPRRIDLYGQQGLLAETTFIVP